MLIDGLIDRMQAMLGPLQAAGDPRQYFHATYLRTTVATREQLRRGGFEDAGWVERWDVAFAGFYLDALQAAMAGRPPSRPWQIAFGAPPELPALRHVLLGMNAHINFDLPQAIVAVISAEEFRDAALLARREADHAAIDRVLAARVAAEQAELVAISGPGSLLDRLLGPLSRLGTQRFLRESREKVWANAVTLNRARQQDPERYAAVVAELEELSAAKVTTLTAPGQVLLRLAVTGFGVRLPAGPDLPSDPPGPTLPSDMPHLDSSAGGDSGRGDPSPLHLIQSFAGTLSADPDADPLRTTEAASGWLRTAGLLPAESRLTTSEHAALLRLRTSIRDVLAAHAGGREDAEAAARLTKALADGRLVLVVDPASTVRLASAARASYPNLVAEIAIAMAASAASGTWPRPGRGL